MENETNISPGEKGYEYKDRVVNSSGDKKFIIKSEVNDENGKYLIGDLIPNDTTQEGTKINAELFNNLEERLGGVENNVSAINECITTINSSLEEKANQSNVNTINGQISAINSSLETKANQSDINTINGQITDINADLGNKAEYISNHETRISTLEDSDLSSVNSLQRSVNDFSNRLNSVESRMYTLEANCSGSNGGSGGSGTLTQDQFDNMFCNSVHYGYLWSAINNTDQTVSTWNARINDCESICIRVPYSIEEINEIVQTNSSNINRNAEAIARNSNNIETLATRMDELDNLEISQAITNFKQAHQQGYDFEGKTVRFISQNYNAGGMFEIRFTDGTKISGSAGGGMGFWIHEYSGRQTQISDGYYIAGYFETPITYEWDTDCHETIVESFWIDMSFTGNEFVQVTPQEFNDNISIEFEIVENQ